MLLQLIRRALVRRRAPATLNALAIEHYGRGEVDRAERYFREVVLQMPADVTACGNLAATLLQQEKHAAAIPILLRIVELQPELAEAHLDLGVCCHRLWNNDEAILHYERAIALKPGFVKAYANIIEAYLACCDWNAEDRWLAEFMKYKTSHPPHLWTQRLEPFCALSLLPGPIAKELAIFRAKQIAQSINPLALARPKTKVASRSNKKIRIGYVSADFCAHATADLTFNLYATHDRRQFEIFAYSMGPDDGSVSRKHIARTCDRFIDVRYESVERTALRIKGDEIDILIDMKGYTANSRPHVFAYRPAPIQVNYLGYPGTSGADFIDYFISDPVATPPGYDEEFTEKLVYLPDSYQINDNRQPIAAESICRSDFQLPRNSFVYCSFNRLSKIDRVIFSVWMEILRQVPDSILWLLQEDPRAESNLQKEAESRNIDPERVIFSKKLNKPAHLARHRLADLFLDTRIYNAHTGASDALWAGLPVLTCPGGTFATRVAASLLCAAGLPELIAHDLIEYEKIAVRLAKRADLLAGITAQLARNRLTCPLFDTPRYVKHLESAYSRMYELHGSGRPPESFSVKVD